MSGEIIRMKIMNDGFWLKTEEFFVDRDRCLQVLQCLQVLHISNVLADKGILVPGHAEGVFELRTAGQNRTGRVGKLNGKGSVSSRPAKRVSQMDRLIFLILYCR